MIRSCFEFKVSRSRAGVRFWHYHYYKLMWRDVMGVRVVWMGIEQQVATKNWEWVRESSSAARYTSICSSSFPILYARSIYPRPVINPPAFKVFFLKPNYPNKRHWAVFTSFPALFKMNYNFIGFISLLRYFPNRFILSYRTSSFSYRFIDLFFSLFTNLTFFLSFMKLCMYTVPNSCAYYVGY